MIHIPRKKGFVLALAIYFVILATITSVGIYAYSEYIMREAGIGKVSSTRGYYCSVAGARYAYILLQNQTSATGFGFVTAAMNSETKTLTIGPSSTGLGHDLNLSGNDTLTITAQECTATGSNPDNDPNWNLANPYKVTADFQS